MKIPPKVRIALAKKNLTALQLANQVKGVSVPTVYSILKGKERKCYEKYLKAKAKIEAILEITF